MIEDSRRWARLRRISLLVIADTLAVLLAGGVAYLLWALPVRGQPFQTYVPAIPLLLLITLGFAQAGLYPGFGLGPVETLRRYWTVVTLTFVGLAALTFALRAPDRYSRMTLAIAFALTLVLAPLARTLARRIGTRWVWWREPAVLVGTGRRTSMALSRFGSKSDEFIAVGILTAEGQELPGSTDDTPPVLGAINDAARIAKRGIRTAFVDVDRRGSVGVLDELRLVFPRVLILRDIEELPVDGVNVRNLGGLLGLEYASNLLKAQSRWVKRGVDITLGSLLFVLTLPIILLAMLLIRIADGGPATFSQLREGRDGRPIRVPKIRTMVKDADDRLEAILRSDSALSESWDEGFKLENDPRIVPGVGHVLRRFSIDELPQLWSVIIGDMSLVGPRPFPVYHLDALSPQARQLRQRVRPGLTGMWQVTARGVADIKAQEKYDTYYIRNWSIWLDLYIIAHTFGAVLSGRGAH